MYARSTMIQADPSRVDEGIAFVRQRVQPMVEQLEGSAGLAMIADRSTGRCVVTTAWRTEPALRASDAALASIREQAAAMFGNRPSIEEWQLAELHRARQVEPGCWSRTTRLEFDPVDADRLVETFRTTAIPAVAMLPGFRSAALLIDPAAGQAVGSITFDDQATCEASRDRAAEIRRTSTEKAHARVVEVMESEVIIAGLRLPDEAR